MSSSKNIDGGGGDESNYPGGSAAAGRQPSTSTMSESSTSKIINIHKDQQTCSSGDSGDGISSSIISGGLSFQTQTVSSNSGIVHNVNTTGSSITVGASTTTLTSTPANKILPKKSSLRGHYRSASHGGVLQTTIPHSRGIDSTAVSSSQNHGDSMIDGQQQQQGGVGEEAGQKNQPRTGIPSAMKKGHTRAASQGQISEKPSHLRGHQRAPSKTDFILPPGHVERERLSVTALPWGSSGVAGHGGETSGHWFKGHSRQASRSESIYTLRQNKSPIKNRFFFWKRVATEDPRVRVIVPNHRFPSNLPADQHPNAKYPNNHIRTTKYTAISFLPKNLFEQFHRFANLYFISIVLLNWIPLISAFGKEIAMLPVMFVLGVTAIKDAFEDRRRRQSDKRINNSTCRVYKREDGCFVKMKWKDMRVGDLIHLSCNEMIPADIVVLRTNDPNGVCYIETMNLDGESNLKQREVIRGFVEKQNTFQPTEFNSSVEVGPPTTKIYHFTGNIIHPNGTKVPITKENLLLRDCLLKNTDFVEGIVVYAGRETKAMLNNSGPRHKRSGLERMMNLEVMWCVVILAVLCIVGATGSSLWMSSYSDSNFVPFALSIGHLSKVTDENGRNLFYEAFLSCLTFIIILQVMIPLSLYVTIELTKLMQIYHIHQDIELYDPESNKRIECRAMNIPEDLGQIQYVFSDKTGTLTENKMVFRRCTIGGIDYNHEKSSPITEQPPNLIAQVSTPLKVNPTLNDLFGNLNISLSVDSGRMQIDLTSHAQQIHDFFMILAVCNTVVVSKKPHHDRMNSSGVIVDPSASQPQSSSARLSPIRENVDGSPIPPPLIFTPSTQEDQSNLLIEYSAEQESISIETEVHEGSTETQNQKKGYRINLPTKRPRFLELLPTKRPLSPISSSNETTPTESPAERPRFLHISNTFSLLSRFNKTFQVNQPILSTPSPAEIKPIFEAESPDELALVEAAYAYNCKLLNRTPQFVKIAMPGEGLLEYEILHTFPFDSNRKRMSVILKHPITYEIILYTKGADSAIFPRVKYPTADRAQQEILAKTQLNINNYAREGLRILVMAKRILSEPEYLDWLVKFRKAELDLNNREALMNESYSVIETNLEIVGATGIEDRLQDGVPETIESLRKAGIVVWVLTGDKQETAVNIAYSCKLFSPTMDIIKLNTRSKDAAEQTIKFYLQEIEKLKKETAENGSSQLDRGDDNHHLRINSANSARRRNFSLSSQTEETEPQPFSSKERALVVDGRTLTYILDQRSNLLSSFLTLTCHCSSVLCCRSTPLQKAYIVNSVKDQLGMRTLAIGDGANDVSMIQRADIGIGISGKEGMQAVMASDFAISKFKYLERLLLVHGHWCYDRLARMILYFFYKNAAFVFVVFWYQLLNGWSASVMIDQMYLMVFNLFFTALPPMAIGIYDQDAPAHVLLAAPRLYKQGRLQKVHQAHSFWLNMLDALYQSVIIFFIAYGAYNGSEVGMFEFGTTIVVSCMYTMLLQMAIEAKSWTIIHVFSVVASIIIFYGFAFVYNSICITCLGIENPYWVIHELVTSPIHWLVVFVTTVLALLPRLFVRTIQTSLFPNDVTKVLLSMRYSNQRQDEEGFVTWSRTTSFANVKNRISCFCCGFKRKKNVRSRNEVPIPTVTS